MVKLQVFLFIGRATVVLSAALVTLLAANVAGRTGLATLRGDSTPLVLRGSESAEARTATTPTPTGSVSPSRHLLDAPAPFDLEDGMLFKLRTDGSIWVSTGAFCDTTACQPWVQLDNNLDTATIAAVGRQLYQLHHSGSVFQYTGTRCGGGSCPGWELLDSNPSTIEIAAGSGSLAQRRANGEIWTYSPLPCSEAVCEGGWSLLDNDTSTVAIAYGGLMNMVLYKLRADGSVLQHWPDRNCPKLFILCYEWLPAIIPGIRMSITHIEGCGNELYAVVEGGTGSQVWAMQAPWGPGQMIGTVPGDADITASNQAGGVKTFLLDRASDYLYNYIGPPCDGTNCTGWQLIDYNMNTSVITVGTKGMYQLRGNGQVYQWGGQACGDMDTMFARLTVCPNWGKLDDDPLISTIVASKA